MAKDFFTATGIENLDWYKCIAMYTDETNRITQNNNGVKVKLIDIMPQKALTPCFLHKHTAATKYTLDNLKHVNSVKCRQLQTRLHRLLCG